MNILIPNNKNINVLFLCSGLCENELKIVKSMKEYYFDIDKIAFMDIIYKNSQIIETITKDVKQFYPNVECNFMTNFSELLKVKYDIIISINFQVMLFIDDINQMNNYYDKKWNIYCVMQELYVMYFDTQWLYYDSLLFDISDVKKYNGFHFNEIAQKIINQLPIKFVEGKLNSLVKN